MKRRLIGLGSKMDEHTVFLLHFDKEPISDITGKSVSQEGTVAVVSNGKFNSCGKFGDGVLLLDRSWYASLLSTENFTIDFWMYPTSYRESLLFGSSRAGDGVNQCGALFLYEYRKLGIAFHPKNASNVFLATNTYPDLNKWSHIAVTCENGYIRIFINGVLKASGDLESNSLPSYGLRLGGQNRVTGSPLYSIDARIDEFRVSDIARWTSNFTPPTSPY